MRSFWIMAGVGLLLALPLWAADPVVGSILSQFELLQKDVARRREQANNGHKS